MPSRKTTNPTTKKGLKGRPDWKPKFLRSLQATGVVSHAVLAAKVHRTTAYAHYDSDPEFARAWDEAIEFSIDGMEVEARRRAVSGTEKPVFQGGVEVGRVREYSDTLLIFLMKANRPDKYREPKSDIHIHSESKAKPDEVESLQAGKVAGRLAARKKIANDPEPAPQ